MKTFSLTFTVLLILYFCFAIARRADSQILATPKPDESKQPADGEKRLTVAEARARAKLMHDIYAATLDSMHHHFFRRERSVLPARALEDVFAEIANQSNIKAGWISVNTKTMSVHHEPKNSFEKNAAKAIAAGKSEFELVEDGYYRRAEQFRSDRDASIVTRVFLARPHRLSASLASSSVCRLTRSNDLADRV